MIWFIFFYILKILTPILVKIVEILREFRTYLIVSLYGVVGTIYMLAILNHIFPSLGAHL